MENYDIVVEENIQFLYKPLFLDIDGVLNPVSNSNAIKSVLPNGQDRKDQQENDILWHLALIDRKKCEQLEKFIEEFEIERIIICSTWRLNFSLKMFKYMFYIKGFDSIARNIMQTTDRYINIKDSRFLTCKEKDDFLIEKNKKLNTREKEILHNIMGFHINNQLDGYYILDDDVHNLKNNKLDYFKSIKV